MTESTDNTRENLLNAAESLFSEHGIQAASLRAITQQAGANLAAVHYHFGSKEGLVRAVFSRRLEPMNRERLRMLEAADLEREDGRSLEEALCAFLAPVLRRMRESPDGAHAFSRLMGRAFSEPSEEVRAIVLAEMAETFMRFVEVFAGLLPHLSRQELLWRLHFVAGTMAHTLSCGHVLEKISEGQCRPADEEQALSHLVAFTAAGLRAPALAPPSDQGD